MRLLDSSGLLVVAAGTTQATATLLINGLNGIKTAAAGSGVILTPNNLTSDCQVVFNGGANPGAVWQALCGGDLEDADSAHLAGHQHAEHRGVHSRTSQATSRCRMQGCTPATIAAVRARELSGAKRQRR